MLYYTRGHILLELVSFLTTMLTLGMPVDGDTEFDVDCIYELIKGMRRGGPETVGVCGAVLVKFDENPWGFWYMK